MHASKLIDSLATLRATYDKPPTDMDMVRQALQAQVARASGLEMPPILTDAQRKVFADDIDRAKEFLESEDGADAVELLVCAFAAFAASERVPEPGDPTEE